MYYHLLNQYLGFLITKQHSLYFRLKIQVNEPTASSLTYVEIVAEFLSGSVCGIDPFSRDQSTVVDSCRRGPQFVGSAAIKPLNVELSIHIPTRLLILKCNYFFLLNCPSSITVIKRRTGITILLNHF